MNKIFISYSRKDENFARRLAADLDRDGVDVWIDVEDIPSGANWSNAINDGLNQAEILILVMSPSSLDSKNVEDEWQFFHNQNKPILPVYIAPGGKVHYQLARLQYIDFHEEDYETAYDAMLVAMQEKGFTIERLAQTLARLEEQRRQIEAERDRLKEEADALQRATTERNRLQEELNALRQSEEERQRLSVVIQNLQKEERKYEQIKEAEAKRATGNEETNLQPVYSSTATFQIPVRLKKPEDTAPTATTPTSGKRNGAIAGAGILALLVLIGGFFLLQDKNSEKENSSATPTKQSDLNETPDGEPFRPEFSIVNEYVAHTDYITAMEWSADTGGVLMTGGRDWGVYIWWKEGRQKLNTIENYHIRSTTWSPSQEFIAVMEEATTENPEPSAQDRATWWGNIYVYQRSDQQIVHEFNFAELPCNTQSDLLWDDSSYYLIATCNAVIYLFDLQSDAVFKAEGDWGNLIDIDFSADYAYLAGMDDNGKLYIWNSPDKNDLAGWANPEPIAEFGGVLKGEAPLALEWSPSSYIALIGGNETGLVRIWDIRPAEGDGGELATFENDAGALYSSLAWMEGGDALAVGDTNGILHYIDVSSNQIVTIDTNHDAPLTTLSWTDIDARLAAGYGDGYVIIWTP